MAVPEAAGAQTVHVDFIVIGGGIAGASAASALAEDGSVALVEQEATTGYHSSGRSASVLSETSGHPVLCALAAASRSFFESPPTGFAEHPLVSPRGLLWVGRQQDTDELDVLASKARAIAGGGTFEPDAMAIDSDALLQGFVRSMRARGGLLLTSSPAVQASRMGQTWEVTAGSVTLRAPIVVNAAGAWGDVVAHRSGVRPIGLRPKRRTVCIVALADVDPRWPMVMDIAGRYYVEPDPGGLLVSPADATPSEPCDAQAEEIDVALALDEIREATTLPVRSVRRAWAGLRTFSPDDGPVVGEDPDAPGFWWLVGQAGAGIKTAPAMAAALVAMIHGRPLPAAISGRSVGISDLSPVRFRLG